MALVYYTKDELKRVFAKNNTGVVEYRKIFSAGKWYREAKYVFGDSVYPMRISTFNALLVDGTLVLAGKKAVVIGESPFDYTNRYANYRIRGRR